MAKLNEKYLVVCKESGIFYGTIVELDGRRVKIKNGRKIRYWDGAACVEQLAMEGTKKPDNCKFTMVVPEFEVFDLIQLLPCSADAIQNIEGVKEWKI